MADRRIPKVRVNMKTRRCERDPKHERHVKLMWWPLPPSSTFLLMLCELVHLSLSNNCLKNSWQVHASMRMASAHAATDHLNCLSRMSQNAHLLQQLNCTQITAPCSASRKLLVSCIPGLFELLLMCPISFTIGTEALAPPGCPPGCWGVPNFPLGCFAQWIMVRLWWSNGSFIAIN